MRCSTKSAVGLALTGLLLLSASVPGLASAQPTDEPPKLELEFADHGPIETAVLQNSFDVGKGPDGRDVMLIQGGTTAWGTVVGAMDPLTGELLDETRIPEITQSLSPVTGPDGRLYVPGYPGDYKTTNLMAYDPATKEVENLGIGILTETHLSRIQWVGDTLWAGTFPNGHVQSYDLGTKEYTDHGRVDHNEWYARSIAHDGQHTIYVGAEGTGRIIQWNLETGEKADLPQPPTKEPSDYTVMLLAYEQGMLFGRYGGSSTWHAYDTTAGEWVDSLPANPSMPTKVDPSSGRMYFASNGANGLHYFDFEARKFVAEGWAQHLTSANSGAGIHLMDLGHPDWPGLTVVGQGRTGGIWRYNPTTKRGEMLPDAELPKSGQSVRAMHLGPDDKLYFGMSFNARLLSRFNLSSGEFEKQAPFTTAQIHSHITTSDGAIFMGSYTDAGLIRYDPSEVYEWEVNPRKVHDFDADEQDRVFGLTELDGKLIVGTTGQRGKADGVIGVYDLATGEMTTHVAPLPGHQITAMATVDGVVIGGTSIVTPGADPVASESKIFAFDPVSGEILWEEVPLSGNATIAELTVTEDGLIWGLTNDDHAFQFDPVTRTVVQEVVVGPGGSFDGYSVLREGVDGHLYGATASGSMFRLNPENGDLRSFDQQGVSIVQTQDGTLHWTDGVSLFSGRMIDREPPTISASFEGKRTVEVTVSAHDDLSEVASVEYRVGSGDWQVYTGPFTVDRRPGMVMEYRASDTAGNVSEIQTLSLRPGPPGRPPGPR